MVKVAEGSQLQTVTRLRDACLIGHRVTRTYGELRKRGRWGQLVSAGAYPLMWMAYVGITCLQAGSTVHNGAASLIAPNPVSRPRRRLWRGLLLVALLALGVTELITRTPPAVRQVLSIGGIVCVLAWVAELVASWQLSRQGGSLRSTADRLRRTVAGPVVRGGTFAAWPQRSGQFGPLLSSTLAELNQDGVTLLVQARDDGLAEMYIRHGGVRPDPAWPRHIVWLASRPIPDDRTDVLM
jgi:hypothetical protein